MYQQPMGYQPMYYGPSPNSGSSGIIIVIGVLILLIIIGVIVYLVYSGNSQPPINPYTPPDNNNPYGPSPPGNNPPYVPPNNNPIPPGPMPPTDSWDASSKDEIKGYITRYPIFDCPKSYPGMINCILDFIVKNYTYAEASGKFSSAYSIDQSDRDKLAQCMTDDGLKEIYKKSNPDASDDCVNCMIQTIKQKSGYDMKTTMINMKTPSVITASKALCTVCSSTSGPTPIPNPTPSSTIDPYNLTGQWVQDEGQKWGIYGSQDARITVSTDGKTITVKIYNLNTYPLATCSGQYPISKTTNMSVLSNALPGEPLISMMTLTYSDSTKKLTLESLDGLGTTLPYKTVFSKVS